jgi:cation transport ATPase
VTLLKGDLTGIVRARHLSHATMSNIRQTCFSPLPIMSQAYRWPRARCARCSA